MTYTCQLKFLTNEQLRERQISLGLALDRTYESTDPTVKKQKGNIRKRYQRILDEIDRRKKYLNP